MKRVNEFDDGADLLLRQLVGEPFHVLSLPFATASRKSSSFLSLKNAGSVKLGILSSWRCAVFVGSPKCAVTRLAALQIDRLAIGGWPFRHLEKWMGRRWQRSTRNESRRAGDHDNRDEKRLRVYLQSGTVASQESWSESQLRF